ncbi:MAG: hypothetical protein KJO53_03125 [Eudoraea sp.]|nr:hypothetical protein [Eudoraea sp.]
MIKNICFDYAEMDSPISKKEIHPYGRGRTKERIGREFRVGNVMFVHFSIADQMYKLN